MTKKLVTKISKRSKKLRQKTNDIKIAEKEMWSKHTGSKKQSS